MALNFNASTLTGWENIKIIWISRGFKKYTSNPDKPCLFF